MLVNYSHVTTFDIHFVPKLTVSNCSISILYTVGKGVPIQLSHL